MKKMLVISFLISLTFIGCKNNSDEIKIQVIRNEIGKIITQKEEIAAKIKSQPNILNVETLDKFPSNRSELELVANEQIRLFNEIKKLDQMQVEELKEAENLKLEPDFVEFLKVMRMTQEKTIELTDVRIRNFQLILDKTISTKEQLKDSLLLNEPKLSELKLEIKHIEDKLATFKQY